MRTFLHLEDVLDDQPQHRGLIKLFEEDTAGLRTWCHSVEAALRSWRETQRAAALAAAHLAAVIASYREQRLPLDQTNYDIPAVTGKLASMMGDMSQWLEMVNEQVDKCVRYPIIKLSSELDDLVEEVRPAYTDAQQNLDEAEERFAKAGRKDAPRKLEELNNDVFLAKMQFHQVNEDFTIKPSKVALNYCARLNALQSTRYTHLIEPLLALIYAWKSFFSAGHDSFKSEGVTTFLTTTQQEMQKIDTEGEKSKKDMEQLLMTLSDAQKHDRDLYYGEPIGGDREMEPNTEVSCQKSGYLRIKMKSGLFSNNWDKYFVFTQSANLMWQKADDLAGSLMIDLTAIPGTSAEPLESVDRRFVFAISIPAGDGGQQKEQRWLLQARNSRDAREWIAVVNHLSGSPKTPEEVRKGSKKSSAGKIMLPEVPSPSTPPPPANTPVPTVFEEHALSGYPIQFDLLADSTSHDKPVHPNELDEFNKFSVRFLGSVEVATDQGGPALIQAAVGRVLKARTTHDIQLSSPCLFTIDGVGARLALLDPENTDAIRASFDLADIASWSTYADNDRHFAFISRTRAESGARGRFNCFILSTEDSSTGADVCRSLATATQIAFSRLLDETEKSSHRKVSNDSLKTSTSYESFPAPEKQSNEESNVEFDK